jgi:hypothetical protein
MGDGFNAVAEMKWSPSSTNLGLDLPILRFETPHALSGGQVLRVRVK